MPLVFVEANLLPPMDRLPLASPVAIAMSPMSLKSYLRSSFTLKGIVFVLVGLAISATHCSPLSAQITTPRVLSSELDQVAKLNEQLINRLHATTDAQIAFLHHVTKLVDQGKLERRLVFAVQRYAIGRNSHFPFPYFERALRFEAAKRHVTLPSIRLFQSTALPRQR